ncbi:UNVERIFIED_CONTAM: hypothetical protein HDU68_012173 [Siphonaria sp. JEL0065]|nr:hypothetical protein HDU68_012173 [Siphonaria sp. JEL0065]
MLANVDAASNQKNVQFTVCDSYEKESMIILGVYDRDCAPLDYFFACFQDYESITLLKIVSNIVEDSDAYDLESSRVALGILFMMDVTRNTSLDSHGTITWRHYALTILRSHPLVTSDFSFLFQLLQLFWSRCLNENEAESFMIQSRILKAIQEYLAAYRAGSSKYITSAWKHDENIVGWLWKLSQSSFSWKAVAKELTCTWLNHSISTRREEEIERVLTVVLNDELGAGVILCLFDSLCSPSISNDCTNLHSSVFQALETFDFQNINVNIKKQLFFKLLNILPDVIESKDVGVGQSFVRLISHLSFAAQAPDLITGGVGALMGGILSSFETWNQMTFITIQKSVCKINFLTLCLELGGTTKPKILSNTIFLEILYQFVTSSSLASVTVRTTPKFRSLLFSIVSFLCKVRVLVQQDVSADTILMEILDPVKLFDCLVDGGSLVGGEDGGVVLLCRVVNILSSGSSIRVKDVNRVVLEGWKVLSGVLWEFMKGDRGFGGDAVKVLRCMTNLGRMLVKEFAVLGCHILSIRWNVQLIERLITIDNDGKGFSNVLIDFLLMFVENHISGILRVLGSDKVLAVMEADTVAKHGLNNSSGYKLMASLLSQVLGLLGKPESERLKELTGMSMEPKSEVTVKEDVAVSLYRFHDFDLIV